MSKQRTEELRQKTQWVKQTISAVMVDLRKPRKQAVDLSTYLELLIAFEEALERESALLKIVTQQLPKWIEE